MHTCHMDLGPQIAAMYVRRDGREILCLNVGLTPAETADAAWLLGQEVPSHVRAADSGGTV